MTAPTHDELVRELAASLDTFRALMDQGALKYVRHLPDGGDALRVDCHDRIEALRTLLARIEGGAV